MDRVAVFVDAGYLFAQGSTALTGSKKPRASLVLDAKVAIENLKAMAAERAPECRLLRIYWYDGALGGSRPTAEQALLAHLDDVKLRLGFVNNSGEQKGVDSLIVTDLIELARLKSISDAVLLSGDEDVRVGVQIAQNFGVRVHLLGIKPARGSQSQQLLQEADTTTEWLEGVIGGFLTVRETTVRVAEVPPLATVETVERITTTTVTVGVGDALTTIDATVATLVATLTPADLRGIQAFWATERGLPSEYDRKLLPICRTAIGRDLERTEMRHARKQYETLVKELLAALPGDEEPRR